MTLEEDMPVISIYLSEDAVTDGILVDITQINPEWERGIFKYVTTNLMQQGYFTEDGSINIPNLLDLLNQSNEMIRKASHGFKDPKETFYSGNIELPNGHQQQIFIEMNEFEKYTIMLPEDH